MKVIVVGGGRIGEALSRLLIKEKHDVVVVEKDEKLAEELAEKLDALVLHGDGTDKNIL
ncbi:MAG: NAD-binding protein, partial [Candidatus Aenigmarchaeota archaeon]|nr:NAD-binding protein [Candidatus Aenigmarchaeota archaeon]